MDFVIFQALGAHRLEGSKSDVEGDLGNFDISRADALQDLGREVQTRGGCSHGTSLPGVDGLITLAIGGLVCALDVGRQWDVAEPPERFVKTVFGSKAQDPQAIFAAAFDDSFEFTLAENNLLAHGDFSSWTDERFPCVWCELADEQDFNRRLQVFVARGAVDTGGFGVDSN